MPTHLPSGVAAVFRALVPIAEREEVLSDLEAEYGRRVFASGHFAARRWAWRQALGSLPALVRRGWWRGMTGFEPRANRMRPGGPMFESWIMDVRYAVRRLLSRRTYAALAILTLALGVGGTAAIFSVMRTLLLKPLPIAQERQVGVFWFPYSWNESEFLYLRPNFRGFQRVAAYRPDTATLEVASGPLRLVEGLATSSEFFDVLGASPLLGRTFQREGDAARIGRLEDLWLKIQRVTVSRNRSRPLAASASLRRFLPRCLHRFRTLPEISISAALRRIGVWHFPIGLGRGNRVAAFPDCFLDLDLARLHWIVRNVDRVFGDGHIADSVDLPQRIGNFLFRDRGAEILHLDARNHRFLEVRLVRYFFAHKL